jgi:outer membrane protein OmpA-like peptidoglycan-associated protein
MKKIFKSLIVLFAVFAAASTVSAQVNTLYYMKMMPTRHDLNPAFQPTENWYIGLPTYFHAGVGNNSLAFNDVFYPKMIDGHNKTIMFWHEGENQTDFYDKLGGTTKLFQDLSANILSFGFRKNNAYWNFSIAAKEFSSVYLPKDLFKFGVYGMPDTINVNKFNLDRLSFQMTAYTEIGLGYSKVINERLTVGGKAKFLIGLLNTSFVPTKLRIEGTTEYLDLQFEGQVNTSVPYIHNTYGEEGLITYKEDGTIDDLNTDDYPSELSDFVKWVTDPAGIGGAIDLGVSYKITDRLSVSAALMDLGFISWNKNKSLSLLPTKESSHFTGVPMYLKEEHETITNWADTYGDVLLDSINYKTAHKGYTTLLPAKLLVGAEYGLVKDKITVGVLSRTTYLNKALFEEVTASLNIIPSDFFNANVSYSVINGNFGTIGLGLGGRLGPLTLYVAGDYMPFNRATWDNIPVPYKNQAFNVQAGLVFTFGRLDFDNDGDGVKNRKDKCPYTPVGALVDKYGCPIDSDGDGVTDDKDLCPNTPQGVTVDANGCPVDNDGDGVPDYLDQCPDTPYGVAVDENGCPIDSDGDGVPDYLDQCPDTPAEAYGKVDANGCPLDSDGDGVPDYLDQCPDTPAAAYGKVDANGCPKDTDGDGIPDYLDKCPTLAGTAANNGCPELKQKDKEIFEKALHGIQFATGKDVITKNSYPILDAVVMIMKENPSYFLEINGHTDNVGKVASNQVLSEKRATAVKNYLIKKGIAEDRLSSQGFGDTKPLVPNTTAANKAKNRRVEFIVKYEK